MMTDTELIKELRKYRCADLCDGMDATLVWWTKEP